MKWYFTSAVLLALIVSGNNLAQSEDADVPPPPDMAGPGDDASVPEPPKPNGGPDAEDRRKGHKKHRDNDRRQLDVLKHMLGDLELSEQQQEQIRSEVNEHLQRRKQHLQNNEQQLRELREQMHAAREAQDHEQTKAIVEQFKSIMQAGPKPEQLHAAIKSHLNEEQAAELEQRIEDFRQRMEEQREARKDGERMRPGDRLYNRIKELDGITEEQLTQVRTLIDDHATKVQQVVEANKEQLQQFRVQAREAMQNGNRQQARELMKQARTLMNDAPKPQQLLEQVKAVLTAEQQEQLMQMIKPDKDRREKMRERMEERRDKRQDRQRPAPDEQDMESDDEMGMLLNPILFG